MPNSHAVSVVTSKNSPPWSTSAAASPGFSPRHGPKHDWNMTETGVQKILWHFTTFTTFTIQYYPVSVCICGISLWPVSSPLQICGLINIDLLVLWLDHAFGISQDPGRQLSSHARKTSRLSLQSKLQESNEKLLLNLRPHAVAITNYVLSERRCNHYDCWTFGWMSNVAMSKLWHPLGTSLWVKWAEIFCSRKYRRRVQIWCLYSLDPGAEAESQNFSKWSSSSERENNLRKQQVLLTIWQRSEEMLTWFHQRNDDSKTCESSPRNLLLSLHFQDNSSWVPHALMSLRLLVAAVMELTVEEKTTMPRTRTSWICSV